MIVRSSCGVLKADIWQLHGMSLFSSYFRAMALMAVSSTPVNGEITGETSLLHVLYLIMNYKALVGRLMNTSENN